MDAIQNYGAEVNHAGLITIDGSVLEGGGQILRLALALSALTGQPINVQSIRSRRSRPGLAAQHAAGISLCAELCDARTSGVYVGSSNITFEPGLPPDGIRFFCADAITAGSTTLLAQASLPIVLFARHGRNARNVHAYINLDLKGGTNADLAPQSDYMEKIFLPFLKLKMGVDAEVHVVRRGLYPRGGGQLQLVINPLLADQKLRSFDVTERGNLMRITGYVWTAGTVSTTFLKDLRKTALNRLKAAMPEETPIRIQKRHLPEGEVGKGGSGSGVLLLAHYSNECVLAGDAVGKNGVSAQVTAAQAVDMLLKQMEEGGCVDEHLQDQLILFMALADGDSALRVGEVTLHTQTAIHICGLLTEAKFDIETMGKSAVIRCKGIAF